MSNVALRWDANPPGEFITGYEVWGADGTSVAFGSCILLATVNALTWTEVGLPALQDRTYYIVAVNSYGSSSPDGPLNITTPAGGGGTGDFSGPGSSTAHHFVQFADTTGKLGEDGGLSLDTDGTLAANSDAKIPSQKAVKTYADTKAAGPGSATDNDFAQFDGTTGKLLKDGGLARDTDGTLAANSDSKIPSQKAVKTYVDGKVAGLSWKQAVRAATTVAGTLASSFENGDAIDGVTLATGDRILIKNQSSGSENGIYVVNASGAPTRATDADAGAELVDASVFVSEGTTLADTQWTCTTNAPITINSTSLTFAQLSSGSTPTGANPTATASDVAVNGSALTFMRSDGAPAVQKGSNSQFGLVKGDGATVSISGGVASATGFVPSSAAFHPGFVSGRFYTMMFGTATTLALAANTLYAHPFFVPTTTTFSEISIASSSNTNAKHAELGIYNNSNGQPSTLAYDAGEITFTGANTNYALTGLSLTLTPGWYWLVVGLDNAATLTACNLSGVGIMDIFVGGTSRGDGNFRPSGSWTYASNALPSNFPAITYNSASTYPLVFLKL